MTETTKNTANTDAVADAFINGNKPTVKAKTTAVPYGCVAEAFLKPSAPSSLDIAWNPVFTGTGSCHATRLKVSQINLLSKIAAFEGINDVKELVVFLEGKLNEARELANNCPADSEVIEKQYVKAHVKADKYRKDTAFKAYSYADYSALVAQRNAKNS